MVVWEIGQDPLGKVSLTVSWNWADLVDIDLTSFDLRLLRECDASDAFADKLVAAELIVRKLETKQQQEAP